MCPAANRAARCASQYSKGGPSGLQSWNRERRKMNIKTLQEGLKYRGRVTGVRQTYHVFEAKDYFFVLSFARSTARRGSGYFNVVDQEAVHYVQARLGGRRGVTAKETVSMARR